MNDKKTKHITGGMKDGIGIAQDVKQSSTDKNDRETASEAGKISKKPGD